MRKPLTKLEREVADLINLGLRSPEIARVLEIPARTVDIYRARVLQEMEVGIMPDLPAELPHHSGMAALVARIEDLERKVEELAERLANRAP